MEVNWCNNFFVEVFLCFACVYCCIFSFWCVYCCSPVSWNFNFVQSIFTKVDSFVVQFYNVHTFFAVRFVCSFLHVVNCFVNWQDVCQSKECRLQNCVCTFTHTDFFCKVDSVDCVNVDVVFSNVSLSYCWQVLVEFFIRPLAVDKECAVWFTVTNHCKAFEDVRWVVTCNEVSFVDVVCRFDTCIAKAEVRNCQTVCFL